MRRLNARPARSLLALMICLCCGMAPSFAASLQEAQNLLRRGQTAQALEQTEKLLSANPKDRSTRFLKGVILTEMNRLDEAISVFTALTQEAPELPEPYNNLAVIYAQQRQYDKAKAALEMAIRTHPAYAVAHENLGDLYAKMARQAYDRALQIDAGNANAQTKLNLIRDIISNGGRSTAARPSPTVVAAAPAAAVKPAPAPVQTPAAAPSSATIPAPAPAAKAAPAVVATAPAAVTPPPAAARPAAPEVKPAAPAVKEEKPAKEEKPKETKNEEAEVRRTVLAWADAWSRKDVKTYLSYYGRDFQAPGGSRSAWEQERRERVGKPGSIRVTVSDLKIDMNGDKATARFRQGYSSSNLNSSSGKTLVLVRQGGRWAIQQERIGR